MLAVIPTGFPWPPDYSGNMNRGEPHWRKLLATITNERLRSAASECRLISDAWPDDSESRNVERIKKDLEDGHIEATVLIRQHSMAYNMRCKAISYLGLRSAFAYRLSRVN